MIAGITNLHANVAFTRTKSRRHWSPFPTCRVEEGDILVGAAAWAKTRAEEHSKAGEPELAAEAKDRARKLRKHGVHLQRGQQQPVDR